MTNTAAVHSKDEVLASAVKYFNGNDLAAEIWTNKYALRDNNGTFIELTPDETQRRLAKEYARIEKKYPNPLSEKDIMDLFGGFTYMIPAGSPLFGVGNPYQFISQGNCFAIGTHDSYGGICRTDERIVQIAKRRGGVGVDISPIRPKGMPTKNAAHTTDGIVVFMERFSRSCREVAQAGRRGALMLTISVHHPEIMNFIKAKSDLKRVTGANVSVRVTDEFMKAVKEGKTYQQRWPVDSDKPSVSSDADARTVWNEIIMRAHANAEPGILFWDTIIRNSPADCYADLGFKTMSTNPCLTGETLVYVADKRVAVSIEDLAENGKDVDVFCCNDNGRLCIRKMRHPRMTRNGAPVVKVSFSDGSRIRVTEDHKFRLANKTYKQAKDLVAGDKLTTLLRLESAPTVLADDQEQFREPMEISGVEQDGTADVYSGTVDEFHNFFVGGFAGETSGKKRRLYVNNLNCGELPLNSGGSCLLSAMNLSAYVKDPFTKNAEFDYRKFREHVKMGQRLMDDLVDIEQESIDRIIAKVHDDPEPADVKRNEMSLWKEVKETSINGRRTGLGITALGDCLAMLGVKYGSDESVEIVKKIYRTLRDSCYESSVELAEERGKFPIFDAKREVGHPFLDALPKALKERMAKSGRRNIACMTTAPVGTTSNIVQLGTTGMYGTTSGFEPLFMAKYTRRKKMSSDDPSEADFTDEHGDRWKEFEVSHTGVQAFVKITGKKADSSPYAGSEAEQIDFVKKVEMQAGATVLTDHAISNTINLPADVSVETVGNLYMKAWESGLKGVTVYRQGSREGVMIASKEPGRECDECDEAAEKLSTLSQKGCRPTKVVAAMSPKRPEILECDIHRSTVGGGHWVFIVGKLHGRPYELFGGDSKNIEIPKKFKTGWVIKDGKDGDRSLYDLVLGDLKNEEERTTIRNIAKVFSNYSHAPFGRLVSAALRHGVPIKWIAEQITKDPEGDMFSYHRALARIMKKYILDGESSGMECPTCHSDKMVYKNGCAACMACGHSSCS